MSDPKVVPANVHFCCTCGSVPDPHCQPIPVAIEIVASRVDWDNKMNRQLVVCPWCRTRWQIEARHGDSRVSSIAGNALIEFAEQAEPQSKHTCGICGHSFDDCTCVKDGRR